MDTSLWTPSHRFDPETRVIADRHYNRQKPGTPQFVPPGRCLVLKRPDAFWVTSWPFAQYTRHDWAGAWVCSAFRNEGSTLSSTLIVDAVARTRERWPDEPRIVCKHCGRTVCFVSFVNVRKTRRKRDPGRCYVKAGWQRCCATTKGGLVVLHLDAQDVG